MAAIINDLVPQVQSRLEEAAGSVGDGQFWSEEFELRTAITEAMNDLMLLIGRPTQVVDVPFSLVPNTVWQIMPQGYLFISDLRGPSGDLRYATLHDMDYIQSSWSAAWESDTDPQGPVRWGHVGTNMFFVHPASSVPQTVTLDAIQYPVLTTYPYVGTEAVPFHDEMLAALEMYAAGPYLRLKEGGSELQSALTLYQDYMAMAKRLTQIEDRRDPLIFSPTFGAASGLDALVKR